LADIRRGESTALDIDVLTIAKRRDDGRVRRWAPDAVFLQRLDQRGLGEARRGFGEVLGRHDAVQLDAIAFGQGRQHVVRIVLHRVVQAFLIDGNVAGFDQRRAVRAQHGARRAIGARQHVHGNRVEYGRRHLTGHGTLPNQGIQPKLVELELLLDVPRQNARGRRADRLVRLLGILRFGAKNPRFLGEPGLAVQLHDDLADLADGFLRQVEGVGAHVGDESDLALADVDALVQLLGDAHGLLRAEAQFARGFLLQRGGREGRGGIALALRAVHGQHGQLALGGFLKRALDVARSDFGRKAELLDFGYQVLDQLARKFLLRMFELGVDGPIFARDEGGDFVFALADHAQCRTLYAAGG